MSLSRSEQRLESYRSLDDARKELAEEWTIELMRPPYSRGLPINHVPALRSEVGPILVVMPLFEAEPDPLRWSTDVIRLRAAAPAAAIVVRMPSNGTAADTLSALLNRFSRHGVVVIPATLTAPRLLRGAMQKCCDLSTDLPTYFRHVLPRWPRSSRAAAHRLFMRGFRYNPEEFPNQPLARKHPVWMQVGRAMAAAIEIQAHEHPVFSRIAFKTRYADSSAMRRALLRAFGVTPHQVAGTVGWEWLVWRFLSSRGQGKRRGWDRL